MIARRRASAPFLAKRDAQVVCSLKDRDDSSCNCEPLSLDSDQVKKTCALC